MLSTRLIVLFVASLMIGMVATVSAQGVQTGSIRGTVSDQQQLALPGVTVTATSSALQGERMAVTDERGSYSLSALPAGTYRMQFALDSFVASEYTIPVALGLTAEQNVTMRLAGVSETIEVVGSTPAAIATPVVGANFQHEEIEALPNQRHLQAIAQLSPAVTEMTPNQRQLSINGAFGFDNVFMIDGVDVNDNLLAQPNFLFIEDAIQETQVLTSGISAEYGRFTGGVVNAITRSGGNTFAGSFRVNFLNPAWTDETPFETRERLDDLQHVYEGTLGGRVVRDRLWFFGAGRFQSTEASSTLPVTGLPFTQPTKNHREEIKLTGTLAPSHTVQAGYLNNSTNLENSSGALSLLIDPSSLDDVRRPNWYYVSNYRGVLGDRLLAEAQYSERRFTFELGGTSTDIVDSVFLSVSQGRTSVYNAPLGNEADPEQRNNRQVTWSLTGFWSGVGRHDTKGGYEFFRSQRSGLGSGALSSTDYLFITPYATDAAGQPRLDASGRLMPDFITGRTLLQWLAPIARNPVMNTDANSVYLQDHWVIHNRWSADLGARFEHVAAVSTGNIIGARANRLVPRLATAYDLQGNGAQVIHATYGQYSGRYNENQFGANSPVARTATLTMVYLGPSGQGRGFAPGFDLASYRTVAATDPTANVFMDSDLRSPLLHEFTVSYGANLGSGRGFGELAYVYRRTTDLIEDFLTTTTGSTRVIAAGVDAGLATNVLYRNTDLARREYQGLVFQSRYRLSDRWTLNGHHTLQIKNEGNYEGEAPNDPGQTSLIGDYPEVFNPVRHFPDGRLKNFQRHRLRVWSSYDAMTGRYGDVSISGLWRVDSGGVYSLVATGQPLTPAQAALLAAHHYASRPANQSVYFGERGSETFKGYAVFDTSVTYNFPLFGTAWVKFDVYNVLNNQKLISWNTTVTPDPTSARDDLGLATGFVRGPAFGRANSTGNFPRPFGVDESGNAATGGRTFRISLGLRF